MVWISNEIWNLEAQYLKIHTNGPYFVKLHLKSRQKCIDLKWSSFQMVGIIAMAQPFENCTIWNLIFRNLVSNSRSPPYWTLNDQTFVSCNQVKLHVLTYAVSTTELKRILKMTWIVDTIRLVFDPKTWKLV